jgi:CRP-like cAMP-binding protein
MSVLEALKSHPFTRDMSEPQLESLVACSRLVTFLQGEVIFREESDASTLYLILSGRVALEQHVPGRGDLQLENLTGGDMLGLSWLLPGRRWVLDARAAEETDAVALDAACVRAAMDAEPVLGLSIAKHVIHQLYHRLERARLQRMDVYRGAK